MLKKKKRIGTSLAVQWLRFHLLTQGVKIPHTSWPKTQNIKQKQYCHKFNKDFKKGPHQKKKILNKNIMSARWLKNHFAIFAIQLLLKKRERTYYWSWSLLNSYPLPNLNFITLKKLNFKVFNCSFNTKVQNLLNPTTTVHFEILVPIAMDLLWGTFPSFSRLWAQSNRLCVQTALGSLGGSESKGI